MFTFFYIFKLDIGRVGAAHEYCVKLLKSVYMKYALVALLLAFGTLRTSAQKHYLYTDGGLSLAYFDPGVSATYNYNPIKYIGIGAGFQGYVFHPVSTNPRYFTPAIFADVRFRIRPERISQYFIIVDLGMNFYKHNNDSLLDGGYIYTVPKDNGVYVGLAIGYFLRLTYRGWGPYVTVKLINNIYKRNEFEIATNQPSSINADGGTLILSLGFRFGDDSKEQRSSSIK